MSCLDVVGSGSGSGSRVLGESTVARFQGCKLCASTRWLAGSRRYLSTRLLAPLPIAGGGDGGETGYK